MVACMHDRDNAKCCTTVNEPAGAQNTNSMSPIQARDVNQQPYPGQSTLNPQRGSYSTGDSIIQGTSGSTTTSGGRSSDIDLPNQNPNQNQ